MSLPPLLIAGSITVALIEYVMWRLFCIKVRGLCLPLVTDASAFSFFTLLRMRIIVLLHTTFLMASLFIGYLLVA